MTEHKFTDEEVIKALERCILCNARKIASCDGCLLEKCYPNCDDELEIMCLALINRQKAEIEDLKETVADNTETLAVVRYEAIKEYLAKVLGKKDIAGHYVPDYEVVSVSVLEYYAKEFMEGENDEQTEN